MIPGSTRQSPGTLPRDTATPSIVENWLGALNGPALHTAIGSCVPRHWRHRLGRKGCRHCLSVRHYRCSFQDDAYLGACEDVRPADSRPDCRDVSAPAVGIAFRNGNPILSVHRIRWFLLLCEPPSASGDPRLGSGRLGATRGNTPSIRWSSITSRGAPSESPPAGIDRRRFRSSSLSGGARESSR